MMADILDHCSCGAKMMPIPDSPGFTACYSCDGYTNTLHQKVNDLLTTHKRGPEALAEYKRRRGQGH